MAPTNGDTNSSNAALNKTSSASGAKSIAMINVRGDNVSTLFVTSLVSGRMKYGRIRFASINIKSTIIN